MKDITYKSLGQSIYAVYYLGKFVGLVFRYPKAWSYGQWFIAGEEINFVWGMVENQPVRKPRGHKTRQTAAEVLVSNKRPEEGITYKKTGENTYQVYDLGVPEEDKKKRTRNGKEI